MRISKKSCGEVEKLTTGERGRVHARKYFNAVYIRGELKKKMGLVNSARRKSRNRVNGRRPTAPFSPIGESERDVTLETYREISPRTRSAKSQILRNAARYFPRARSLGFPDSVIPAVTDARRIY